MDVIVEVIGAVADWFDDRIRAGRPLLAKRSRP